MLIIRKPEAEPERDHPKSRADRKPAPAKITKREPDDCEYLDDPNSLFWRGVWMTVF